MRDQAFSNKALNPWIFVIFLKLEFLGNIVVKKEVYLAIFTFHIFQVIASFVTLAPVSNVELKPYLKVSYNLPKTHIRGKVISSMCSNKRIRLIIVSFSTISSPLT